VLGVGPKEPVSKTYVQERYRIRAAGAHPDKGGSHDEMSELNRAREEALAEVAP